MVSLSRTISLGLLLAALGLAGAALGQDAPKDKTSAQREEATKPPNKPQTTAGDRARPADVRVSPEKPKAAEKQASAAEPKRGESLPLGTFADWVIVIFTGALTWVAIKQHFLEKRLAADTSDSIDIAKRSAMAAEESLAAARQHNRLQLRPWLAVSVRATKPLKFNETMMHADFEITIKNVGLTPAVGVRFASDFKNRRHTVATHCEIGSFYDGALETADENAGYGLVLVPNEEICRHVGTKIFRRDFGEGFDDGDGRRTYLFPLLLLSVVYRSELIPAGKAQTTKTIFVSENLRTGGRAILVEGGDVPVSRIKLSENGVFGRAT